MLQWINRYNHKFLKTTVIMGMAVVFFVTLFSFTPVFAQTGGGLVDNATLGNQYAGQIGLGGADIRLIIVNIIRVALGLVGLVMVILMLYAGFLWMTAGGNDDQIVKAKNIIRNAVIGLAIVLSAYGIVLFVMNLLGIGEVAPSEVGVEVGGLNTQNFRGSGALGTIIKDHYPMRNQEDVPRNTKIAITFRRPIKLSSFVNDTSGNNILGDCKQKDTLVWKDDCDQLKIDDSHINISRVAKDDSGNIVYEPFTLGASVFATSTVVDGVKGVYTIVLRPNDNLGSSAEKYTYLVHLGNQILLDDPINRDPSAFNVKILGNDYYEWQFSCSTMMDFDPPHVISVYPKNGGQDYKNTALQVTFSEPMDPTGLQGSFVDDQNGSYYFLQGKNLFLKSDHSIVPAGSFNIVNNYQTLEFIPSKPCGKNTCGGTMYCMNVCDKAGCDTVDASSDPNKTEIVNNELFKMVIRAATTYNANSFEAKQFTGAMDMASNALDSAPLGHVDMAGSATDPGAVNFFDNNPDNYYWSFSLMDKLYDQPPVLSKVVPGLEAEMIKASQPWKMDFAGMMLFNSLYTIDIQQHSIPEQTIPLCKAPRAAFDTDKNTTSVNMYHCPFLDGRSIYYFPTLTSDIMEVHFNCFDPGKGPGGEAELERKALESSVCDDAHPENCCVVDPTGKDPDNIFCCNGATNVDRTNSTDCINEIKDNPPPQ